MAAMTDVVASLLSGQGAGASQAFVVRVMAVTLAVVIVMSTAGAIALLILNRSVPPWLPGVAFFVLGSGSSGVSHQLGAANTLAGAGAASQARQAASSTSDGTAH